MLNPLGGMANGFSENFEKICRVSSQKEKLDIALSEILFEENETENEVEGDCILDSEMVCHTSNSFYHSFTLLASSHYYSSAHLILNCIPIYVLDCNFRI